MTQTLVRFEQNGGEYSASLVITSRRSVKQLAPRVVKVDGVTIEMDEIIEEVRVLEIEQVKVE